MILATEQEIESLMVDAKFWAYNHPMFKSAGGAMISKAIVEFWLNLSNRTMYDSMVDSHETKLPPSI